MEGFEARRAREAWALRRFGWSIEWMIRVRWIEGRSARPSKMRSRVAEGWAGSLRVLGSIWLATVARMSRIVRPGV